MSLTSASALKCQVGLRRTRVETSPRLSRGLVGRASLLCWEVLTKPGDKESEVGFHPRPAMPFTRSHFELCGAPSGFQYTDIPLRLLNRDVDVSRSMNDEGWNPAPRLFRGLVGRASLLCWEVLTKPGDKEFEVGFHPRPAMPFARSHFELCGAPSGFQCTDITF